MVKFLVTGLLRAFFPTFVDSASKKTGEAAANVLAFIITAVKFTLLALLCLCFYACGHIRASVEDCPCNGLQTQQEDTPEPPKAAIDFLYENRSDPFGEQPEVVHNSPAPGKKCNCPEDCECGGGCDDCQCPEVEPCPSIPGGGFWTYDGAGDAWYTAGGKCWGWWIRKSGEFHPHVDGKYFKPYKLEAVKQVQPQVITNGLRLNYPMMVGGCAGGKCR